MAHSFTVAMTVNGHRDTRSVSPHLLLVDYLRDHLGLTGTHVGCDTSQCGACTVLLDGVPVKSCTVLAVQADESSVMTVEGLSLGGTAHPLQEAFRECHALQCGYCTPGVLMTSIGILTTNPNPTASEIREALDGVLCRCTGYENIVEAIAYASRLIAEQRGEEVAQ